MMATEENCPQGQAQENTRHLQRQSLRLEQAVTAMRAVSDMAAALQARGAAGGRQEEIQIDGLAGLFDVLATAIEVPLKELDGVIGSLEHQARLDANRRKPALPDPPRCPTGAI